MKISKPNDLVQLYYLLLPLLTQQMALMTQQPLHHHQGINLHKILFWLLLKEKVKHHSERKVMRGLFFISLFIFLIFISFFFFSYPNNSLIFPFFKKKLVYNLLIHQKKNLLKNEHFHNLLLFLIEIGQLFQILKRKKNSLSILGLFFKKTNLITIKLFFFFSFFSFL